MTAIATNPSINSHGANDIERGGSSKRRFAGRRGGVGLGRFTGVGESMLDLRRIRSLRRSSRRGVTLRSPTAATLPSRPYGQRYPSRPCGRNETPSRPDDRKDNEG